MVKLTTITLFLEREVPLRSSCCWYFSSGSYSSHTLHGHMRVYNTQRDMPGLQQTKNNMSLVCYLPQRNHTLHISQKDTV